MDVGSENGSMYEGSRRSSSGGSSFSSSSDIREGAGDLSNGLSGVALIGVVGVESGPCAGFGDFVFAALRSAAAFCRWIMYFDALLGRPFSPTSAR